MARLIITEPADRLLRDRFKISGWVHKPPERRARYYGFCQTTLAALSAVTGGNEVPDDAVILVIRGMLHADDTFSDHLAKKDAAFLINSDNWARLERIAAGTIYHEYLVAVEKGRWP